MPRHRSVTDEFVEKLQVDLAITGKVPYRVALRRVVQGWTQERIEKQLKVELVSGKLLGDFDFYTKGTDGDDK